MGDFAFRSEPMSYLQLMMDRDAAHATVEEIAKLGCMHFVDSDSNTLKTAFQRPWSNEVRLCTDLLRQLRLFRAISSALNLEIDTEATIPASERMELIDLQATFAEMERELNEVGGRQRVMDRTFFERLEHKYVLLHADLVRATMQEARPGEQAMETDSLLDTEEGGRAREARAVQSISGVIRAVDKSLFERVVWRVTKGNAILKFANSPRMLAQYRDGQVEEVEKDAFVLFYSGRVIGDKLNKLCDTQDAHKYHVPNTAREQMQLLDELNRALLEHQQVTTQADKRKSEIIADLARRLGALEERVLAEQAIYATMNLFNSSIGKKTLVAEGWVPDRSIPDLRKAVQRGMSRGGASIPSVLSSVTPPGPPPTLTVTNKLSATFQSLNDAYGTPRYLELNPGIFYPVTYSFLFGIMFGDIGHGTLMLVGALFFISREKTWEGRQLSELLAPAYDGRYVLLLMSIFSIYCGCVYNECFGLSLLPWSYWEWDCPDTNSTPSSDCSAVRPAASSPFGVDPIWGIAANKLAYQNSFKMKISIIIGVSQMVFGLACKTSNCLYFKRWRDLLLENLPEYIFLLSIFGYLSFLIILKWCTDWVGLEKRPPPLLDTLLGMILRVGSPIEDEMLLYPGQATVQLVLLSVAAIAVPWMLLPKPLMTWADNGYNVIADTSPDAEHKKTDGEDGVKEKTVEETKKEAKAVQDAHGHGSGPFDIQEAMIHQSIHTIEFVLGAISNTASYLRLWALSLAHAGLSEVFWERVMLSALEAADTLHPLVAALAVSGAFAMWAAMTFGVLMVMETLSACLHDIRLHWVEFQNKFYGGDGYPFVALSFGPIFAGYKSQEAESVDKNQVARLVSVTSRGVKRD